MVVYFIGIALIPAIMEEYFFRNTICKSLTIYGKGTAIIISSVLFSLMHANIEQIFCAFVAGVLLSWIYVETKSVVLPIVVHFLNNAISAIGDIIKAIHGEEACAKYKNVYFIDCTNASDELHETSVDGTHPNDYGYTLWAQSIQKPLLKILKKHGIK